MEIVFLAFLVLLFLGMPVAFAAGISGTLFFVLNPNLPFESIVQIPATAAQNSNLLAVPLFILAGVLMNASGITERLVALATLLMGHFRGGLSQSSVVLSALMGGASGSANAEIAMESRILAPHMEKEGYPRAYTASVIGYSALITATIPPGVGLILYGSVGDVSIGRLFAAGLTSGAILMLLMLGYVAVLGYVRAYPRSRSSRASAGELLRSLRDSALALAFPVLLLGSLRLGFFTVSEVGAFACAYAILIGTLVYRKLTWKRLLETVRNGVLDVCGIMYLIAMAALFGYGIPFDRVPERVTEFLLEFGDGSVAAIALIIVALLFFGMFMEGAMVIILLTPILVPVVQELGIDPVVFGVILALLVTLGVLTPPFGIGMLIMTSIIKMPFGSYIRESLPFVAVVLATVIVYLLFPEIVLALPNLIYG